MTRAYALYTKLDLISTQSITSFSAADRSITCYNGNIRIPILLIIGENGAQMKALIHSPMLVGRAHKGTDLLSRCYYSYAVTLQNWQPYQHC